MSQIQEYILLLISFNCLFKKSHNQSPRISKTNLQNLSHLQQRKPGGRTHSAQAETSSEKPATVNLISETTGKSIFHVNCLMGKYGGPSLKSALELLEFVEVPGELE